MRSVLYATLILGFVVVDFLFFHDVLKPGETFTAPQILTGALSVPVLMILARSLFRSGRTDGSGRQT